MKLKKVNGVRTVLKQKSAPLSISFNSVENATGYLIRYRLADKKWKEISTAKTQYVIKNLKANALYDIQVRAYADNNGKKIYGDVCG